MAKKKTDAERQAEQAIRRYESEERRIAGREESSKRRKRSGILRGIGQIIRGNSGRGLESITDAVLDRTEDKVRNGMDRVQNEQRLERELPPEAFPVNTPVQPVEGSVQDTAVQQPDTVQQQVRPDTVRREIPVNREGANGMTVDQLIEMEKLKKTDPKRYNEEVKKVFTRQGQQQAPGLVTHEPSHGVKL